MKKKTFDELTFTDDFAFCCIMSDHPDICKELTELITGKKIRSISDLKTQESLKFTYDGKGVRFDVTFDDEEGTVYDIEMQTTDRHNLPMRARYYQSMQDRRTLRKGCSYSELKNSYIIFLCTFDPFGAGSARYVAKTMLEGKEEVPYNDGVEKIFVCSENLDQEQGELHAFLQYMKGMQAKSSLTEKIEDALSSLKRDEERRTLYMTFEEKLEEACEEAREVGREEGLKEGREEGRIEGREKGREEGGVIAIAKLITLKQEKGKDIAEIASDLEMTEAEVLELINK